MPLFRLLRPCYDRISWQVLGESFPELKDLSAGNDEWVKADEGGGPEEAPSVEHGPRMQLYIYIHPMHPTPIDL